MGTTVLITGKITSDYLISANNFHIIDFNKEN
jgi:hypothetical protein